MVLVPAGVSFDADTRALSINGMPVKIYYFQDNPTMPWFCAKPIHTRLGATKIGHTLARVSASRKSSLKDLIDTKGQPLNGGGSFCNQNDLKAMYVNEPGLYDIILGSHKEEAMAFRDWVTGDVLPTLRQTGSYSVAARLNNPSGGGAGGGGGAGEGAAGGGGAGGGKAGGGGAGGAAEEEGSAGQGGEVVSIGRVQPPHLPQQFVEQVICLRGSLRKIGVPSSMIMPYATDVAMRMLSLKCAETAGEFDKTRLTRHCKAHKYVPEDADLFRRAVRDTVDVYEKRARDVKDTIDVSVKRLRAY